MSTDSPSSDPAPAATVLGGPPPVDPAVDPVVDPVVDPDPGGETFKHLEGSLADYLPAEYRDDPSMKVVKDLPSLAKMYVHGQKSMGANKINVPTEHATPEDWKQIFVKLGLPPTAEEYEFDIAEGSAFAGDEVKASLKEALYEEGLLPRQAEAVVKWYDKTDKALNEKATEAQKATQAEALSALKTEQGKAWPKFVQQADVAVQHLTETLGVDLRAHFNKTGIGNDAVMVQLLSAVGANLSEGKIPAGASAGDPLYTPAQAQVKINEIMGNGDHPYFKGQHPSHKDAVNEMERLYAFAHPDSKPIDMLSPFIP